MVLIIIDDFNGSDNYDDDHHLRHYNNDKMDFTYDEARMIN